MHTPLLYFATFEGVTKNGVMITGSHNPKEYNGFKIVINNSSFKEEDIQNLKFKIEQSDFKIGSGKLPSTSQNNSISSEEYFLKISGPITPPDPLPQSRTIFNFFLISIFFEISLM